MHLAVLLQVSHWLQGSQWRRNYVRIIGHVHRLTKKILSDKILCLKSNKNYVVCAWQHSRHVVHQPALLYGSHIHCPVLPLSDKLLCLRKQQKLCSMCMATFLTCCSSTCTVVWIAYSLSRFTVKG